MINVVLFLVGFLAECNLFSNAPHTPAFPGGVQQDGTLCDRPRGQHCVYHYLSIGFHDSNGMGFVEADTREKVAADLVAATAALRDVDGGPKRDVPCCVRLENDPNTSAALVAVNSSTSFPEEFGITSTATLFASPDLVITQEQGVEIARYVASLGLAVLLVNTIILDGHTSLGFASGPSGAMLLGAAPERSYHKRHCAVLARVPQPVRRRDPLTGCAFAVDLPLPRPQG